MGQWFIRPLGNSGPWSNMGAGRPPRLDFVCRRCGQTLQPCMRCGLPSLCGDLHCEFCQPDDQENPAL